MKPVTPPEEKKERRPPKDGGFEFKTQVGTTKNTVDINSNKNKHMNILNDNNNNNNNEQIMESLSKQLGSGPRSLNMWKQNESIHLDLNVSVSRTIDILYYIHYI